MILTRLMTIALLILLTTASAFAQFEKEAGKIAVNNALFPCPANNGKIAFLRFDEKIPGTPQELYLIDLATGKETRLLPGVNFANSTSPTFALSPDGSKFIVPVKGTVGSWELVQYTVGSRKGTQLGDLAQYVIAPSQEEIESHYVDPSSLLDVVDLTWSPSGKKLMFTMVRPSNSSVWWMDAASGRSRQATEDRVGFFGSFHPNEDMFCYTDNIMSEGITANEGILLRSLTTGDIDTLCNEKDEEFGGSISPDGKFLVYSRIVDGTTNVWMMNLSTRQQKALTNSSGGKNCSFPRWSFDGKKIYFQGNNFLPQPVIFVRDFTPF